MKTQLQFKNGATARGGFSLLELLLVLLILSLGFGALLPTAPNDQDQVAVDDLKQTIIDSRNMVHFARELSLSSGETIGVQLDVPTNTFSLLDQSGQPLASTSSSSNFYRLAPPVILRLPELLLSSDEVVSSSTFYFNEKGLLVSKALDEFEPLKTPLAISATGYNNGDDDGAWATDDEAFLLISNVTGELIPL